MSARVLISGAAGGIGAATTAELRSQGAQVEGIDLAGENGVISADVRDQESVDRAVAEAIERLGGLDVLINCAGLGTPQSAGVAPDEKAVAVIDVNLLGPWRVTAAALPALREAKGRVVNIASGLAHAHLAFPFATSYCMSKAGLVAYSDMLRMEHGDAISVTTVYPGYISTGLHDESKSEGFSLEDVLKPETLEDAARCLAKAALGPPKRDVSTTRSGRMTYALMRHTPSGLKEKGLLGVLRRQAKKGSYDSSPIARDFGTRLKTR